MNALDQAFSDFHATLSNSELVLGRTYGFYTLITVVVLGFTALSVWFVSITDHPLLQFINAIVLSVLTVQGGMLGHDLAHNQVFRSSTRNRFFATLAWGLLAGISAQRWYAFHGAHHAHPNQIGSDPDIDMPFIFSDHQTPGPLTARFILPFQHVLFFIALPLLYYSTVVRTYVYLIIRPTLRGVAELLLITLHFVLLIGYIVAVLPLGTAIMFLLVYAGSIGVYMSIAFAPNHKGEAILPTETTLTWQHQITSTRDVRVSPIGFHLMGGLNFQIEHHLFSSAARPNYWKIQPFVKEFCRTHEIPYHETSWLGSMREIYTSLKKQADQARRLQNTEERARVSG